jgi:hypothetical protein
MYVLKDGWLIVEGWVAMFTGMGCLVWRTGWLGVDGCVDKFR